MGVLADFGRRTLTVSVGDLVEGENPRRIGLGGGGRARLRLGQRLHTRLQAELAEESGFRSEVPVVRTVEIDGWTVEIHGRADGVLEADGRILRVDEIKSVELGSSSGGVPEAVLERYRRQVRLYAWLLARPPVLPAARLLLVDVVTGRVQVESVPWSQDAVLSWLRSTVHRIVSILQRRSEALAHGRHVAAGLPFPHREVRPHQRPMMEAVERALGGGRPLLLEAPTGSGKTAAVLHPALRYALETGRLLVHLTSTTLQQRAAVETLRPMTEAIAALQIRAKAKMCAHTEMICHEAVCPYAEEYSARLEASRLLENLLAGPGMIEPDHVFEAATAARVCPFEASLDLLPHVRAVVCDYNYVFDPGIGLEALLGGSGVENAVLVVDEAHNLVDRARNLYSPRLEEEALEAALLHLEAIASSRVAGLTRTLETIREWIRHTAEPLEDAPAGSEVLVELDRSALAEPLVELESSFLDYLLLKRERELWIPDDPVVTAFSAVTRFATIADLDGEELVPLARWSPGGSSVSIVCLDPSRFLGPVFEQAAGVIAMSATLQPFEHLIDMAGLRPLAPETFSLPSPFPARNRLVAAVTDVDTTWRGRTASAGRVAEWIARLAVPGANVLVLFPSYAYLRMVRDTLPPIAHELLVQEPGAPEMVNRGILRALASGGGHLLLAVMGGMYAEGVDYPGEMLSEVIVVSPGLPRVSTERLLLREFLQERYGRGFEYALLVPGMRRVVQAAGRLIRSETDRGVIILVGRRFLRPPYVGMLPGDWTAGNPSSLLKPDLEEAVQRFLGLPDEDGAR